MKTLCRRLMRLEEEASCGRDKRGRTMGDILRERKRRNAEANGERYEEPPRPPIPPGATIADILRSGRRSGRTTMTK